MSNEQAIIAASSIAALPPTNLASQITLKLTSTNYLLWKTQVLPLLRSNNLFHHVDGSTSPPSSSNTDYLDWYKRDQLVLSWIVSSLSENVISQVVRATTARQAWQKLETAFASGSRAQVRQLKNQLRELKRDNEEIAIFMQRAKGLADQLAALQHPIDEDDLVESILHGLGPAYRPFIRSLEARLESVCYDDLFGLLLSEEIQLKVDDTAGILPTPTAQFASRSTTTSRGRGRGRGFRGRGRTSNFSSGYSPAPSAQYVEPPSVTCFNCKGTGHFSRQCPSPRQQDSRTALTPKPSTNLAATSNSNQHSWIVDSGATHHLTSDMENLGIHNEYQGHEAVTIGYPHEGGAPQRPE